MSLVEKMFEKVIHYIGKDENKNRIHMFILDPILNHIIERIFPYFIILSALFTVLVILIIITCALIFWKSFPNRIGVNVGV